MDVLKACFCGGSLQVASEIISQPLRAATFLLPLLHLSSSRPLNCKEKWQEWLVQWTSPQSAPIIRGNALTHNSHLGKTRAWGLLPNSKSFACLSETGDTITASEKHYLDPTLIWTSYYKNFNSITACRVWLLQKHLVPPAPPPLAPWQASGIDAQNPYTVSLWRASAAELSMLNIM